MLFRAWYTILYDYFSSSVRVVCVSVRNEYDIQQPVEFIDIKKKDDIHKFYSIRHPIKHLAIEPTIEQTVGLSNLRKVNKS